MDTDHTPTTEETTAFLAWYEGRRSVVAAARAAGVSDVTIRRWRDQNNWHERARLLDLEAGRAAEIATIHRRRERILRDSQQADFLRLLAQEDLIRRKRFADHMEQQTGIPRPIFNNASEALAAYRLGREIEAANEEGVEWMERIATATTEELLAYLQQVATANITNFEGIDLEEVTPLQIAGGAAEEPAS